MQNSKCKIIDLRRSTPIYFLYYSPSKLEEDEKNVYSLLLPL